MPSISKNILHHSQVLSSGHVDGTKTPTAAGNHLTESNLAVSECVGFSVPLITWTLSSGGEGDAKLAAIADYM